MMITADDPPELPDEISTSSKKAKHCVSLQPCQIILEELLYEVFLRLPVKSLIRFRCVSKGICGMIDSSIFARNHNIHRSVKSERDRSLSVLDDEDEDEEYAILLDQYGLHRFFSVNFDNDDDNNNLNRAKAIELNCNFTKEGRITMFLCCNGIFCFKNEAPDPERYVFWNPSNATFREVDSSSCLPYVKDESMGYDSVNNDYKIIGFIKVNNEPGLQVYSFRNDSWRKLFHRDVPSGLGRYGHTRAVCLRGVMHWLWTNPIDKSMFILAFDLATETFTSLSLPLEARLWPSHLTDFRGRLCIAFRPRGGGLHTIWVMEKYGVESSWIKFDRTPPSVPIFYFPNNRRRLLLSSFTGLSWWDPQDGSYERIEIPGLLNDQAFCPELYYCVADVYVRNLVRLDQSLV